MSIAIEFNNISKLYRLGLVSSGTIASDLQRWWQMNILGKEDPFLKVGSVNDRSKAADSDYVWALKNINFKVEQGDVVGIIGKNGAGKSTLLKLLSKVTAPTTGAIRAKGRIASLLEVGTGFNGEMTGRENIYMNGAILGMTKQEISSKIDEIIDFSGCERYIDTPVKRYSSGMTVRLGFAVAAHLDPEILVVDEVLAVGDAEFQKKAIGKMQDVSKGEGRTVLFVSHNMGSVAQLCKSGIVLSNGSVAYMGKIRDCISYYISEGATDSVFVSKNTNNDMFFHSVSLVDQKGMCRADVAYDESIRIHFLIGCNKFVPNATLSFTLFDYHQAPLFTSHHNLESDVLDVIAEIPRGLLLPGNYFFKPILHVPNVKFLDVCDTYLSLTITDTGSVYSKYYSNKQLGYFNMPINWLI